MDMTDAGSQNSAALGRTPDNGVRSPSGANRQINAQGMLLPHAMQLSSPPPPMKLNPSGTISPVTPRSPLNSSVATIEQRSPALSSKSGSREARVGSQDSRQSGPDSDHLDAPDSDGTKSIRSSRSPKSPRPTMANYQRKNGDSSPPQDADGAPSPRQDSEQNTRPSSITSPRHNGVMSPSRRMLEGNYMKRGDSMSDLLPAQTTPRGADDMENGDPEDIEPLLQQARELKKEGALDRAAMVYQRCLISVPDNPVALFGMAVLAKRCRLDYAQSEKHYTRLLEIDCNHQRARYNLAVLHYERAERNTLSLLKKLHIILNGKEDPRSPALRSANGPSLRQQIRHELQTLQMRVNQHQEAPCPLRRDSHTKERKAELLHSTNELSISAREDYAKAEAHFRRCIEVDSDDFRSRCYLGIILKNIHNDYSGAEEQYRLCLQTNPDYNKAKRNLRILLGMGASPAPSLHASTQDLFKRLRMA